jgi:hypothetical protein
MQIHATADTLYQRPEGLTGMRAGLPGRPYAKEGAAREINKLPARVDIDSLSIPTLSCPDLIRAPVALP